MTESATQSLRDEHELIIGVAGVLNRFLEAHPSGPIPDRTTASDCISFFQLYADACHHAKEEDLLFPELERYGVPREGGPIGVMLHEHRIGRQLVAGMKAALEADDDDLFRDFSRQWLDLITAHIGKENFVLFEMADQIITGASCERLCADYRSACSGKFGGKTREELEQLSADLVSRY